MNELFSIKDYVVAITGGYGTIGSVIAKYLALQGAVVVILGRSAEAGEALASEIQQNEGKASFLKTDVTDKDTVEQNVNDIIARHGRVDTLINAAGGNMPGATIGPDQTIFDLQPEALRKVLDANLIGTIIPTRAFLRPMSRQKKGSIINFTSMAAFRPLSRVCGYAAAKAGVSNFTAYMAAEAARKFGEGIRINAIAPGFFLTNQNRELLTNPDGTWTQRGADVIRQTPFGRMGKPEELCGTVHYLMSDAAQFVTGTIAKVDGGFDTFTL